MFFGRSRSGKQRQANPSRKPRHRPRLEALEDRLAPAAYTVNLATDSGIQGSGTSGNLRYCITLANHDSGPDTIQFDPTVFASPTTISLQDPLPAITASQLSLQGPGAGLLTISGSQQFQILAVAGGTTVSISQVTFAGGSSSPLTRGGALANYGALTLSDDVFAGNTARYSGGGIFNRGTLTLNRTTLTGNSVTGMIGLGNLGYLGGGGGLNNDGGVVTLTDCTLTGNVAATQSFSGSGASYGGAILNKSGSLSLTDCTLSGNASNYAGGGLANLNNYHGSATLTNVTLSNNFAPAKGGGIYNRAANTFLTLQNTLVAGNGGNSSSPDVQGPVTSASGFNLIGDGTGMTGIGNGFNGNQVGAAGSPINPGLAPLGNYGGPTETLPLVPGSPAIDHGSIALLQGATDQRGFNRINNLTVDIGACESRGFLNKVYEDLLGRDIDPAGLAYWNGQLAQGVSPAQVVQGIQASQEYRTIQVEGLYQYILGRPADPAGITFWVNFLGSGGTLKQMAALMLGSDEFFNNRGGGSGIGFLNATYETTLNRPVDSGGVAYWGNLLGQGATRADVAGAILNSAESEGDLVTGYYQGYLGRPAGQADLSYWVGLLQQGATDEQVQAAIMGSQEYQNKL